MADLFDALTARALGTASVLVPACLPHFAPPTHEPEPDDGRSFVSSDDQPWRQHRTEPEPLPEPAEARVAHSRIGPGTSDEAPEVGERDRRQPPEQSGVLLMPHPETEVHPTSLRPTRVSHLSRPEPMPVEPDSQPPSHAPQAGPLEPLASRAEDIRTEWIDHQVALKPALRTVSAPRPKPADGIRGRSVPAPEKREAPPTQVTVSIGYVEVRAPARPAEPRPTPRTLRPEPRLSLQDYLRRDGRR